MQQNPFRRGPARRILRLVLVVALFAVAGLAATSDDLKRWMGDSGGAQAEVEPITVYPYNFTGQGVEYAIGAALLERDGAKSAPKTRKSSRPNLRRRSSCHCRTRPAGTMIITRLAISRCLSVLVA